MLWIWVAAIWVALGLAVMIVVARAIRLAARLDDSPDTEPNVVADPAPHLPPAPDAGEPPPRTTRRSTGARRPSTTTVRH